MNGSELVRLAWHPTQQDIERERQFLESELRHLGEQIRALAKMAAEARQKSYSPYSGYSVGVSILSHSGKTYVGANAERVGYSETDHAEELAISNAGVLGGEIATFGRRFLRALAVSHKGDSAPCGRCRQIMIEHCNNAIVAVVNPEGQIRTITTLGLLLPYAFTPSDLGI